MSKCKYCDTEIDWITTTAGKKMPVEGDYIPFDELNAGDTIVTDAGTVYTMGTNQHMPTVKGRISHFTTCKKR